MRYYIETATGILSTQVRDADVWEGLSFSMLHKHHFLDFAGKEVRDISTMFWAAAQILMVVLGLILWLRIRKKQETELLTCQGLTVYLFMRLIVYDKQIKITVIKIADN